MTDCESCRLIRSRDAETAHLWDSIYRTEFFDIAHAFNSSLPGWIVVVLRRHAGAIDELTVDEASELGVLLRKVFVGLKGIVGCTKTYVMQFAEQPGYNHVHFHVVPRMADLPETSRGANIFNYLGVDDEHRISENAMNEIASRMHKELGVN
jgi:diadenosine tetraphosphate (Ap4A) HIT family hydrolase